MRSEGNTPTLSPKRRSKSTQSRYPRSKNKSPTPRTSQTPSIQKRQSTQQNETDQSLEYSSLERRNQRLRLKAEAALEEIVGIASTAPPNVRAMAARTLLELVGAIGRAKAQSDQDDRDAGLEPESLSLADIERELRRLSS